MIYSIIAITVLSFGGGWWFGTEVNKSKLVELENVIITTNYRSRQSAEIAQKNQNLALAENEKLDELNEKANRDIDSLHGDLARSLRTKNLCSRSVPESKHPAELEAETSPSGISEEFAELLADQARQADQVAVYAETAYRFIENNCGVKEVDK